MKVIFLTIFILFISISSFCQTGEAELYSEYNKRNKELKAVLTTLIFKLNASEKVAFKKAQDAWLQFRELNCTFSSKQNSESGVVVNKMKLDCLIETTTLRIKELKDLMNGF